MKNTKIFRNFKMIKIKNNLNIINNKMKMIRKI